MIRVLVADNSRIYTGLLADALTRDPALEVIPCETDASGLVASVINLDIDVVVISSSLDEQTSRGLAVLRELRSAHPRTRGILLPESSKDEAVLQAFRAGARGIFSRNEPIELLRQCVHAVHQGRIWANSEALQVLVETLAASPTVRAVNAEGMNLLSDRELQVVHCLVEGLTNREIAARLKLSQHTIKNHLFRIFDKLGVSSRIELLFMTLNQASPEPRWAGTMPPPEFNPDGPSDHQLPELKKAAEGGSPAAQLALAQMYLTRRRSSRDLVDAYKWYMIATERAMQAQAFISKMMTPQQVEEANQEASDWLSKCKKSFASCIVPSAKPARSAGENTALAHTTRWEEELADAQGPR